MTISASVSSSLCKIPCLFVLTAAVLTAGDQSGAKYTFKTIAKTGQTEDRVTFGGYFQPGGINNWGELSFAPSVQSGGESVFTSSGRSLNKIRAAGESLPGGATFG